MRYVWLTLLFALGACASSASLRDSDAAMFAHTQLVGLTKAQILACAGKPDRTESAGEKESLSYSASSGQSSLALGTGGSFLSKERRSCEVIFDLRGGYVETVRYAGARTGGALTPDEECAPIVNKCTKGR